MLGQPCPAPPGAAALIPQVPDSHPVSFDAHVTFEARETIFTLNHAGKKKSPKV